MLTGLRLGNFKAFAETQRLPIKPLTLIFGPNSAGKSSLIHGMVLAHHAIKTGDLDVYRTDIGGESVDLGGFRQYVHRRNKDNNVEWSVEIDVSRLEGRIAELLSPVKTIVASFIFGLYETEQGKLRAEEITDEGWEEALKVVDKDRQDEFKEKLIESLTTPQILTVELMADEKTFLRMSRRRDNKFRLDRLEHEHPILKEIFKSIVESITTTTIDTLSEDDFAGFSDAITDLVSEITIQINKFLPESLLINDKPVETKIPSLLFPISKESRRENLSNATKNFLPNLLYELIRETSRVIQTELERLQYLGPLRSYPPRHIAFSQHEDLNWFAGGGYAWDIVRRDYHVRKKINEWLGNAEKLSTPYELTIRNLLTVKDLGNDYTDIISELEEKFTAEEVDGSLDLFGELYGALDRIEGKERLLSDIQELNLIDKRTKTIVSHRDVGIGVSQVLPVLVGAYASKDKIIAIEQPEIHLHPALQAELGDVFIESALGNNKNTFLIETHSEHLILRIMRRMRETFEKNNPKDLPAITPDDVAVFYIEPDGPRSIVREMQLNERGELVKAWPGGFFEEGLREVF